MVPDETKTKTPYLIISQNVLIKPSKPVSRLTTQTLISQYPDTTFNTPNLPVYKSLTWYLGNVYYNKYTKNPSCLDNWTMFNYFCAW